MLACLCAVRCEEEGREGGREGGKGESVWVGGWVMEGRWVAWGSHVCVLLLLLCVCGGGGWCAVAARVARGAHARPHQSFSFSAHAGRRKPVRDQNNPTPTHSHKPKGM